jgi:malonyl-CoA/methylmalonyl-CoA synthetase
MANTLYDALFGKHAGHDTPFLILQDDTCITHAAFLAKAAQFAHEITAQGLVAGDRLAVQIGKSPNALAVYAACVQSGVIFLPLNTAYTGPEVEYFIENSGAKLVLCDPAKLSDIAPICARLSARVETMAADGSGTFVDKASAYPAEFATVDRGPDDLAAFLYTSGTTGRSKGAMLSHDNLLSNSQTLAEYWQFTDRDILLHALPIFHTHGLFVATNVCLLAGSAIRFYAGFDCDALIRDIPKATALMGVPTFYTRLLDDPRFDAELTKSMRLFVSGSAPLLAETHIQFEERTGHRILERYGMTETNMNTSNPYDGDRRAGTVGYPLPGVELKVCDPETGAEIPTGDVGVIEVRGPNVFKGYWQMPEKTREELRENGFFVTGDLGFVDDRGYVTIVGRAKDLIISGGYNIYPKEIEMILDEQEGVLESAVVGVPHPDFGETVVAVLVPAKGQTPDIAAIQSNVEAQLARFKQPRSYHVMDTLPRNTMGKVQKNILRDQFKDLFAKPL